MTRVGMAEATARLHRRYQATLSRGLTMYDDQENGAISRLYRGAGTVADLELAERAISRTEREQQTNRRTA